MLLIVFLFKDEDEHSRSSHPDRLAPAPAEDFGSGDEEEESDGENFIVDDEGNPIQREKKKKPIFEDENLETARDIFGCEFDFEDFDKYQGEWRILYSARYTN